MKAPSPASHRPRGFQLRLVPTGPDAYGVRLEETDPDGAASHVVVEADSAQVHRVLPAVVGAVKTSGQAKTVLSSTRRAPIRLREEPGVRLGLLLLAAAPVRKTRRLQEFGDAVTTLTAEEAYYWYAKVTGPDSQRLRRALRLFLAGE